MSPECVRLQVLLAEDDPVAARFAKRAVTRFGHEVVHVDNGRDVLVAMRARHFDVLLLDLGLPELDGLGAARALRGRPERGATVIVALTSADLDDETRAQAGIDAVLEKPLGAAQLGALLRSAGGGDRPAIDARTAPTQPAPHLAPVLDLADLRARARGDETLIRSLFEDFLLRRETWTEELRDAAQRQAFHDVGGIARRLRGALNALGARRAGAIAAEVEARAPSVPPDAPESGARFAFVGALTALTSAVTEAGDAMREHLVVNAIANASPPAR